MSAERLARMTLGAGAVAFAGPGLGFLLRPDLFAGAIGLALQGPTASSDVRAVFGGLELGLAAVLAVCALRRPLLRAGIRLLLVTLGAMLLGRALSLSVDGAPGLLGWLVLAVELVVCALAALAALNLRMIGRDAQAGASPAA